MRLSKIISSKSGFSLLEVLIALVITGVVTTALFKTYVVQHENYLAQDDITTIQQSARAAIDEISRNVRMAGNDLPSGMNAITSADTDADTITLTYSTTDCNVTLSAAMPQPSAELKTAGDLSCFTEGQWIYIYDPATGPNSGEWFVITQVQAAANHLQHNTMPLSKSYPKDAVLLGISQIKFFIDDSDPDHPNLMIQVPGMLLPQVYAEDIVDLQFQYRLKNGMVVDEPVVASDIREVMISITGRSNTVADWDKSDTDRDRYRYRSYTSSVNVRNLGN